ncbi:hypothetical protein LZ575_04860 [Antarcticibacterium sp. 1MA-6-2]|uniref:hypothetical protein n=1 Tax=Antarcticibacterium sp. 1MA-6-2 TaxID=2908210 RepID=UPI001F375265|nr:hypothetical protein [Antarcticibacterium sp. 1MA-6-2]UJH91969.1 hypothetical protein LZ575_04860 [Antarcticibacterium sp. 1MA-6-2]
MHTRFNNRNIFKYYGELFDSERHFSLIRPSETRTKYQNFNNRNLLEWESRLQKFKSITRIAFLDENYRYYENIDSNRYSFGEAKTIIGKYDLEYSGLEKFQFNAILTNTYTMGEGSSIGENNRNIFSAALLMKHLA